MNHMDELLKKALTPENEPNERFNQNILAQLKEAKPMKKMNQRKFATVAISCVLALGIGSISIYAAWKYLSPNQVIGEIGEEKLAEAFSGENAVFINETQSYGGYDVTLLGITSGKNLTKYKYMTSERSAAVSENSDVSYDPNDGETYPINMEGMTVLDDRTYIMFAIESEHLSLDSPDCAPNFDFLPIISGYDPETYSGMVIDGSGGYQTVKDNVLYYMYECNNLEKFADRNVYMCVSDDLPAVSEYSYLYDKDSGKLSRNEEYEGLNALFSIPLDPKKADPKAALEEVEKYEARRKAVENEPEEPLPENLQKAFDFVEQITPENINEYATPLTDEGAVQTFGPADAQGRMSIDISYGSNTSHSKIIMDKIFPEGTTEYVTSSGVTNNNPETLLVELYKLNEDGTVTVQMYSPNLPN